jgi:hypothetical protein
MSSSTYIESVQQAARFRDSSSSYTETRKGRNNRDTEPTAKTSSFETAHGYNWVLCEKHNIAHSIILMLDMDLIRIDMKSREQDGCTCPHRFKRNMGNLRGSGDIKREREQWETTYKKLKDMPAGKQNPTVIEDEWDAWVTLWGSIHTLANKRRQQINRKETDEEANWTEEDMEYLRQHFDDIRAREAQNETKPIMYCQKHCVWGDSIPIMHMNRYLDCGICHADIEETAQMKQRREEDQRKKFPSFEVNQYTQLASENVYNQSARKRGLDEQTSFAVVEEEEQNIVMENNHDENDEKVNNTEMQSIHNYIYDYTNNNNYNSINNNNNMNLDNN